MDISERRARVAELAAGGMRNVDIAHKLGVSPSVVASDKKAAKRLGLGPKPESSQSDASDHADDSAPRRSSTEDEGESAAAADGKPVEADPESTNADEPDFMEPDDPTEGSDDADGKDADAKDDSATGTKPEHDYGFTGRRTAGAGCVDAHGHGLNREEAHLLEIGFLAGVLTTSIIFLLFM